jgi:hypothetical protein
MTWSSSCSKEINSNLAIFRLLISSFCIISPG